MVSLLKAIKFVTSADVMILNNIGVPVWKKAIDFVNDKFGVKLPISAEGIASVVKWMMPGNYSGMIIDELIAILSDMSDQEYQEMVKKSKDSAAAKERAPETEGGDTGGDNDNDDADNDNDDKRNEPAAPVVAKPAAQVVTKTAKSSRGPGADLPDTMGERQIRALVRKELARSRR